MRLMAGMMCGYVCTMFALGWAMDHVESPGRAYALSLMVGITVGYALLLLLELALGGAA